MGQLELPFKGRVVLNNFEVANEFFAFDVNTVGDPYGSKFWQKISDLKYEPDTLFFLLSNLEKNDTFIDVGAANGAMTLIAATRCQTVLAFEPEFEIFSCLARNVELNENTFSVLITLSSSLHLLTNFIDKLVKSTFEPTCFNSELIVRMTPHILVSL